MMNMKHEVDQKSIDAIDKMLEGRISQLNKVLQEFLVKVEDIMEGIPFYIKRKKGETK